MEQEVNGIVEYVASVEACNTQDIQELKKVMDEVQLTHNTVIIKSTCEVLNEQQICYPLKTVVFILSWNLEEIFLG